MSAIYHLIGSLTMHNTFEDIDMSSGEWMVLARTRYMLEALEETLKKLEEEM